MRAGDSREGASDDNADVANPIHPDTLARSGPWVFSRGSNRNSDRGVPEYEPGEDSQNHREIEENRAFKEEISYDRNTVEKRNCERANLRSEWDTDIRFSPESTRAETEHGKSEAGNHLV